MISAAELFTPIAIDISKKIAQRNLSPELCDANNNSHNYSKKINNESCYSIQSCYISVHRKLYENGNLIFPNSVTEWL